MRIAILSAVCCYLALTVSFQAVAPYDFPGAGEGTAVHDRTAKHALWGAREQDPEYVIVGSSRAATFPTNETSFNFGIGGSDAAEHLQIIERVRMDVPAAQIVWLVAAGEFIVEPYSQTDRPSWPSRDDLVDTAILLLDVGLGTRIYAVDGSHNGFGRRGIVSNASLESSWQRAVDNPGTLLAKYRIDATPDNSTFGMALAALDAPATVVVGGFHPYLHDHLASTRLGSWDQGDFRDDWMALCDRGVRVIDWTKVGPGADTYVDAYHWHPMEADAVAEAFANSRPCAQP